MKDTDKKDFIASILQVANSKCDCDCHKKGTDVIHMAPCCDKTYQKFD